MNWLKKALAGFVVSISAATTPGCLPYLSYSDSDYPSRPYIVYNDPPAYQPPTYEPTPVYVSPQQVQPPQSYSYGTPGYNGSSYSEFRDENGNVYRREGQVWVNQPVPCQPYRVGLPSGGASPSPRAIQEKFRQDVEIMRQQQRRR